MKIEGRKCINIPTILSLGTDVATKLPQIHAVPVCDTSSFLHSVGKTKVFENVSTEKKNQASKGNWCFM